MSRDVTAALAAGNRFFSEEPWWLENMVRRILETGYTLPLDPEPYEHVHAGCPSNGERATYEQGKQWEDAPGGDEFRPRAGYSQDWRDYK